MCITAWAWKCHPAHHLLLLFNRDEYHSRCIPCPHLAPPLLIVPKSFLCLNRSVVNWCRSTQPVQWWSPWEEGKEILGGKDELGGGTWMGCTRDGKLAFLTNVRESNLLVGAKTRGNLPVRFLQVRLCQSYFYLHVVMDYLNYTMNG
jgi:uncharacterized protein with NRDE domain